MCQLKPCKDSTLTRLSSTNSKCQYYIKNNKLQKHTITLDHDGSAAQNKGKTQSQYQDPFENFVRHGSSILYRDIFYHPITAKARSASVIQPRETRRPTDELKLQDAEESSGL
jgi:hypothetical protein